MEYPLVPLNLNSWPCKGPPWDSHHVPESVVHLFLELWQPQYCNLFPGEPVWVPNHPLGKKPFLNVWSNCSFHPHPSTQCSFKPFPWILSWSAERRLAVAVPNLPWEGCSWLQGRLISRGLLKQIWNARGGDAREDVRNRSGIKTDTLAWKWK